MIKFIKNYEMSLFIFTYEAKSLCKRSARYLVCELQRRTMKIFVDYILM